MQSLHYFLKPDTTTFYLPSGNSVRQVRWFDLPWGDGFLCLFHIRICLFVCTYFILFHYTIVILYHIIYHYFIICLMYQVTESLCIEYIGGNLFYFLSCICASHILFKLSIWIHMRWFHFRKINFTGQEFWLLQVLNNYGSLYHYH